MPVLYSTVMERVKGIGGAFFTSENPEKLNALNVCQGHRIEPWESPASAEPT